jgi:hypothetical protein
MKNLRDLERRKADPLFTPASKLAGDPDAGMTTRKATARQKSKRPRRAQPYVFNLLFLL